MSTRRFWLLIGGATLAIMVGCWLSSGTMAPYGTRVYGPCHYRTNGDFEAFQAVFQMLDGQPAEVWDQSVVLRRILHPLLAFPFMKAFGFAVGGLVFNILSHGIAMIGLALGIRRYFDARAAVLVSWLFATYPGYAYWAGEPFSYAFIVPASILCVITLLWWNDRPSLRRSLVAACVVGVVGLGYDLIPYFGGALILMIVFKRRWLDLAVTVITLGLWALFIARGLPAIFGFPALNSNTQSYGAVVASWLDAWNRLHGWGALLADVPHVFLSNFLFSGSVFFSLLMVWLVALRLRLRIRPVVGPVGRSILLSTLAVFVMLNLAPPYDNVWQLRGTWIARVYQPWFVVVLLVVAATSVALRDTRRYKLLWWSVVIVSVLDVFAIAGPYVRVDSAYVFVNQNFYQDASLRKNRVYFHMIGRRPIGICP